MKRSIPLLSRLYIWSVVFEPLLFFVPVSQGQTGGTGSLGRLLQVLVVAGVGAKLVARVVRGRGLAGLKVPSPAGHLQINYVIYYCLAVVAGFVGFVSGAYRLPQGYVGSSLDSSFSRSVNSELVRPWLEYVIALYYFVYFAILPRYLMRTREELDHFFFVFKAMFSLSFVLGIINLVVAAAFNVELVPRHISDGKGVGVRFNGLAGEPRHAFVYLFLGLAILHLCAFYRRSTLNRWVAAAIVLAALATQSASGLIGFMCFIVLFGIYSLGHMQPRRLIRVTGQLVVAVLMLSFAVANSKRMMNYVESASYAWSALETGKPLPALMYLQRDNIYPLYDLTVKARRLEILPLLIGSGFGSASVAINRQMVGAGDGLQNPNSQLVRMIYESGVLGALFFILAFLHPVQHLTRLASLRTRHGFVLVLLLLLGACLGTRSAAVFIYLGALITVFHAMASTNHDADGQPAQPRVAA